MKSRFYCTLVIIPLLFKIISAQTISQDEFLNQLKLKHPLFEKEKLTVQINKEKQQSFLGDQDWKFLSSLNYSHEKPAIAGMGAERTDALSLSGGVEKLFWETGGSFSTSLSFDRVDLKIDPFFGFPDSYYQSKFAITYIHPLLQNKNGFLNKLQYDLKQYDIDFSEILILENQEDFLAQCASKFLDWVLLSEQKTIVSERLSLSGEALDNARKKRKAHLIDQVDVLRAEDAVLIAKQNLVLVESQWKALQAELAVITQNDELYDLSPEFDLYKIAQLMPRDEETMQLKQNSRLIKTLDIHIKQLKYSRKGYEEQAKPQLSLVAQLNIKNADEGFGNSLKMDKPDAIGGLQFSVPLGNRTTKSQIAMSDLQITQLEKQRDEVTLNLVSALTSLYIRIEEMKKVLTLNQEQIESAKEKTKEELRLYNQGRGDLTFVIQSQDGEQNSKLTYASNAQTYHKLLINYQALTDKLF